MKNSLDLHVRAYEGDLQYDFDNEILLNWYPKRILDFAKGAESLLELGLGHGYTTSIFSKHFNKHVVLEGSEEVIKNFRKKYPDCRVEIVKTYFEDFSHDEKFDVIVLGFVLEHVDDPLKILLHFKKYLKPNGGKMFVSVPNAEVLNRRLGNIAGMLPDMQVLSENDHILGHQRYYTVKTLSEDIHKAGYEIERMEGIYLKPFTTKQILSLDLDKKVIDALCVVGIYYPELSCGILAQIKTDK
jgi:2-polyprenyl-3-methyl-5-hydroxy-6-metoxy-1,4-benzoquinol methylase